jgi:hypothetical protein
MVMENGKSQPIFGVVGVVILLKRNHLSFRNEFELYRS